MRRPPANMGEHFSHFEIVGEMGYGGLGRLSQARDTRSGVLLALALVPDAVRADAVRHERLLRETRIAAGLAHSHVAHVSEVQHDGEREFVTIELVSGERLADVMAQGPLPPARALTIGRHIADALARSHDKGLIHRDLKATNVILTPAGSAKVIDFGLSTFPDPMRVTEALAPVATPAAPGVVDQAAPFMSPEQASGAPIDIRSDVFSFGALLFAMLTGRSAFPGADGQAVMSALLQGPVPALPAELALGDEAADALRTILARTLERDPARRYQSMRRANIILPEAPDDVVRADLLADLQAALAAPEPAEPESSGCLGRGTAALLTLLAMAVLAVR